MLDIAPSELLLVAFVALVVIGPKDLPKAMRVVGYWVGKARGVARQFRSGFDSMVREAELEEMEKRWAAENARIMSEHPQTDTPTTDTVHGDGVHDDASPAGTTERVDMTKPDDGVGQAVHVEKPEIVAATQPESQPQADHGDAMRAGDRHDDPKDKGLAPS